MSVVTEVPVTAQNEKPVHALIARWRSLEPWQRILIYATIGMVAISIVRVISGEEGLTSSGTVGAALRLAVPIGMAGLGGIYSERVGIVNIGLEGMMILGAWFGAYGAWQWGPWYGLAFGMVGGAIGGLIHAVATVTFNVDHIISGVAINIVGAGLARYLSVVAYDPGSGGSATQSPPRKSEIRRVSLPVVSDALRDVEDKHWFLISDTAGVLRGMCANISLATITAFLLIFLSFLLLWKTRFGLRLRSIGENPYAAESLGIPVLRIKYQGVILSGMCAGFGGAFLSVVLASIYRENQTGGKGFIGLATMIFGNWRPGGLAVGALLFGYSDGLQLRSASSVPALFLLAAIACVGIAAFNVSRGKLRIAAVISAIGIVFLVGYLRIDELPDSLAYLTPYVVTLVVLATSSQRLRMPAADGLPYRRGEAH